MSASAKNKKTIKITTSEDTSTSTPPVKKIKAVPPRSKPTVTAKTKPARINAKSYGFRRILESPKFIK